jgi:hypothetical protein
MNFMAKGCSLNILLTTDQVFSAEVAQNNSTSYLPFEFLDSGSCVVASESRKSTSR